MLVRVVYFRDSGKFYTGHDYETDSNSLWEEWDIFKERSVQGDLPGLCDGCRLVSDGGEFYAVLTFPGHKFDHPRLIY